MPLPLLMIRQGTHLVPADQLAEEDVLRLPAGKPVLVEAKRSRSLPHHRLFFGILRKLARSTPTPLSEKALLSWVKVRTGHVETLPLGFGHTYEAPASISFERMSQAEFNEFFDRAMQLILTEVAPGLPQSFTDELLSMLDDKQMAA